MTTGLPGDQLLLPGVDLALEGVAAGLGFCADGDARAP